MRKVLIIDDNERFRETLVDELEDRFHCTEVDRAEKALSLLKIEKFDLVFLDIRLPEPYIDGLKALQEMKLLGLDLSKVITVTGDPDAFLETEVRNAGVKVHLQKGGFSLEKLRTAISTVLDT